MRQPKHFFSVPPSPRSVHVSVCQVVVYIAPKCSRNTDHMINKSRLHSDVVHLWTSKHLNRQLPSPYIDFVLSTLWSSYQSQLPISLEYENTQVLHKRAKHNNSISLPQVPSWSILLTRPHQFFSIFILFIILLLTFSYCISITFTILFHI